MKKKSFRVTLFREGEIDTLEARRFMMYRGKRYCFNDMEYNKNGVKMPKRDRDLVEDAEWYFPDYEAVELYGGKPEGIDTDAEYVLHVVMECKEARKPRPFISDLWNVPEVTTKI